MESRMIAIAEWYANYNSYRYDTRGITIENMFSHPGVKGAGSILMEYMVNKSEHAGELGIICVDALEDAIKAYEQLGFKMDEYSSSLMTLTPLECEDKWYKNKEGEWRFISGL